MEKRLPLKGPQLPENYPSGCRSGLTSFFHLFNGHYSRKLISSAHFNRHKKGNDYPGDWPNPLPASDKKYQEKKKIPGVDSRRGKHEQCFSNNARGLSKKNTDMGKIHKHNSLHEKDAKLRGNVEHNPWMRGHRRVSSTDSEDRVSRSKKLTQVFCGYGCRDISCVNGEVTGIKFRPAHHVADINEAAVNRKLVGRTSHEPEQLLEALEILKSNNQVFLKLLEDPNSPLSRHARDLRDSRGNESLRRIKSQENRIWIVKPRSRFSVRSRVQPVGQSNNFSSIRLRRRLKWTQQKKQSLSSRIDLSLNKESEARRGRLLELSDRRVGVRRSFSLPGYDDFSSSFNHERRRGYGFDGAEMRFGGYGSYQVKGNGKLRLLTPPKINTDRRSSECNEKSVDRSDGPDTCVKLIVDTDDQETAASLVHTNSEGSTEIEKSQEETSSSPGDIGKHEIPIIHSTGEHRTVRLESEETDADLLSAVNYVKAVLAAGELDWDGLLSSHEPDQILWPSLFEEVKVPHDESIINQRLLFDYTNEVLEEVHRHHPAKITTFTLEKNVNYAVMRRVNRDRDLLLLKGSPTLEQLVLKDLTCSRAWVDVPSNAAEIVDELVEDILDDVVSEI